MGLTVYFYKNFSKRDNSTKVPDNTVTKVTYTCNLKDGTSVLEPVLKLYLSAPDSEPVTNQLNYAWIDKFKRYYFVRDWRYEMGVWYAYLSVDVLASYKTEIGNFAPYVLRASGVTQDPALPDSFYPATHSWSTLNTALTTPFSWANRSYIIGFISAPSGSIYANSLGSVTYYYATESQVVTYIRRLMDPSFISANLVDLAVGLSEQAVKDLVDPLQYIASCTLFPFEARSGALLPQESPRIGWYDTSNDNTFPKLVRIDSLVHQFTGSTYKCAVPVNPYASGSGKGFLKFSPYTKYELQLEPFGTIQLDADLIAQASDIYFTYDIDLVTGMARLSVGTSDGSANLGIYNAEVGVPITLSQIYTDTLGAATSIGTAVVGTVGAALSGNLVGAFSSAVSGIGNAVDALKPKSSTKGNNGSIIAYNGSNTGNLLMTYCDCVDTSPAEFGYAYCDTVTSISALTSGYVLCAEGDIPCAATMTEKMQIKSYLTGGFFYE